MDVRRSIIAFACASGLMHSAAASPERSQHPRSGVLAEVLFATDSDALKWGANRKLGRVAGWVASHPGGLVVLNAHADPRGSHEYNRDLALRRAQTVLRELTEAGVPPDRVVLAIYGEQQPRKQDNRRVTIWVTQTGMRTVMARIEARGAPLVLRGDQSTAIATR